MLDDEIRRLNAVRRARWIPRCLAPIALLCACPTEEASIDNSPVYLTKTYRKPVEGIEWGATFWHATFDNFAACQEAADKYNASPSVLQSPGALRFHCGRLSQP